MDLCISGKFDIASRVKSLSISKAGVPFDGEVHEGLICRLRTAPLPSAVNYPYLVVSENFVQAADILMIRDFNKVKNELKKKSRKELGLR